jgi:hypothetical protein
LDAGRESLAEEGAGAPRFPRRRRQMPPEYFLRRRPDQGHELIIVRKQ